MYDTVKEYATILYQRNLKHFGNSITEMDIICEVYAIGFESKNEAVKLVRDVVFKEKRRLMALFQQRNERQLNSEKVCNHCHEPKDVSEFYIRIDSRTGFRYLCNNCKECEKDRRFAYNFRKRTERLEKQSA